MATTDFEHTRRNAELLAAGLRDIRAAAEAGNCNAILRLVDDLVALGMQEPSEPVAETLADVEEGAWADRHVDLRVLRALPPNVKLYAGPPPILGNAEKEQDYAALLAFVKFAFEQRPCDYDLDFGKMREAMNAQYDKILHLLAPHWYQRPAAGSPAATEPTPPARLAIDTPMFRQLLGEYSAACEGSRSEYDEERWITAHHALISYLESLLGSSPDVQPIWLVNDDMGQHVMLCPRAPSESELADVSAKIGRSCTVSAFLLHPRQDAAPGTTPGTALH